MGMHVNRWEGDSDDDGRVSPARVRAYFIYAPDTGRLIYREARSKLMKIGRRAGHVRSGRGFREVKIDGHRFREDRVIWAHIKGRWPAAGYDITHSNGDFADSRWTNLREERVLRSRPRGCASSCGYTGVIPIRGRFVARFRDGKKEISLGTFDTPEEAHECWRMAALERQTSRDMKARGYI